MTIQRRGRPTLLGLALLLAGLAMIPAATAGAAGADRLGTSVAARAEVDDEAVFVARINELRVGLGLAPLEVHPLLVPLARDWATTLRSQGSLSHAPDLSVGIDLPWSRLGENVGVAPEGEIDALFDAFVASPSHYANLVKADYRYIGVGVVYGDDGRIWTAHRFMALDESATTTTSPAPTTTAPTGAPRRSTTTTPRSAPTTAPAGTPTTPTTTPPATTPTSTTVAPAATPAAPDATRALSSPAVARIAFDLALAGI